jgi:hypothetical protein
MEQLYLEGTVQREHFFKKQAIQHIFYSLYNQGFGSGSGLDPYSIGPVDPDPYSESGSGSRRAKITHKSRKNSCFEVLDGLFCELQACNLDILYRGLGIGKLQFLIKKKLIYFQLLFFFNFWSLKPWIPIGSVLTSSLYLWIRIRIRKNEYGSETLFITMAYLFIPDSKPVALTPEKSPGFPCRFKNAGL